MFPSIILVVMSILMFVMPVASQEKVSIGITALLSFFFIILMLADVCPRSSTENLPLLRKFQLHHLYLCCTVNEDKSHRTKYPCNQSINSMMTCRSVFHHHHHGIFLPFNHAHNDRHEPAAAAT